MSQVLNRVERIQQRFPWIEEHDAHAMLVAKYFVFTRMQDLEGAELYAAMEEFVNELMITPDEKLREAIDSAHQLGGRE